jgi:hypothetical protein
VNPFDEEHAMVATAQRPSIMKYLYTHNPFYAISAVLMLYSIRAAYEKLNGGVSNCWLMTGVLAGYTLVLATIGVWIVRRGKVWEDARSILLLLLLLFLAVSISADDLFVKAETSRTATTLLLCGFLFSASVSEAVLWGAGVRLGLRYRIPYHLMLALFYVAPWFYSPGLHPQLEDSLDWLLLLFPVVAAILLLSLLPAVRGGPRYVAANGTPWPWPWFPGTAFGVIAAAVGLRSYALTMTFGLNGPIWKRLPDGRAIVFDTIWGPYFLVPLVAAILILLFEVGLVAGNRRIVHRVMRAAPLLLLLSLPWGEGTVFAGFLQTVVATAGSPLWLTTWILIAFYGWAWFRSVPEAGRSVLAAVAILTIVGSRTTGFNTFVAPQPWPLLIIGAVLFARGMWLRSSRLCAAASVIAACGLWFVLPFTPLAAFRLTICFNVLWCAVLALGLAFRDPFAYTLRVVSAAMFPVATLFVIASGQAAEVPVLWRISYVVLLAVICLLIARVWRNLWFLYGFGGVAGVVTYAAVSSSFRRTAEVIGRDAMAAFVWSLGMLLLAFLISATKARWLPRKIWPWARNGNGTGIVLGTDKSNPTSGLSTDASS